jgi:hypothetical protein
VQYVEGGHSNDPFLSLNNSLHKKEHFVVLHLALAAV